MIRLACDLCLAELVVDGALPLTCPTCCRPTIWRTVEPAWVLSMNDRRLLKGLRIAAD